jgi:hypothetical protein
MKYTGIKATPEERDECFQLADEARNTPAISFGGPDMASTAWDRCKERVHELALQHGLPEIKGFYGMAKDGEFVETD